MKILFVSRGNKKSGITTFIKTQGESLKSQNAIVDYFPFLGQGIHSYFSNIGRLRNYFRENNYNLIHAHYSITAFFVSLSNLNTPIVCSLMGSEVSSGWVLRQSIRTFYHFRWNVTIVKTEKMKRSLKLKNAIVLPNGVNTKLFKPINRNLAQDRVGFKTGKNVVFLSNPQRPEKNYRLAIEAIESMNQKDIRFHVIHNVDYSLVPYYLNAADVLLCTSLWEGSPNIIKEAMACNCPIVSTDVGDVRWLLEGVTGCFVTSFEIEDVAEGLRKCLQIEGRTNGVEKINQLSLDDKSVACSLLTIYESVLNSSVAKI